MFVILWSNVSEKEKKNHDTGPVLFLLFLTGVSVHEMIHFCKCTALKADMLMLFSKDMLGIPRPPCVYMLN